MVKRHDPLFNRATSITASTGNSRTTSLVACNEPAPPSPIDNSRMVLSKIRTATGLVPVWVDKNNRVVYPTRK